MHAALAASEACDDTTVDSDIFAATEVLMPSSASSKRKAKRTADEAFGGMESTTALQKLHSIAIHLRNSPKHLDKWRDMGCINLGIDNATRWSSWYTLIGKSLKEKDSLRTYLMDHDIDLSDSILTSADWDYLQNVHALLKPFATATLYTEGDSASLSQTLTSMDALLAFYERQKVSPNRLAQSHSLAAIILKY